jgi:TPR repeat protein
MSTWRFWLVSILLAGCHRSSTPQPINVAATIAGCANLLDCESKCTEGKAGACLEVGRLYEFGHAVPRDAGRAYPFYDRACTLGHAGGCYNAAVLLEAGRGVSKDTHRASELYGRVCQMGSNTACARAEALASEGSTL